MKRKFGLPLHLSLPMLGVTAVVSVLAMGHGVPSPFADQDKIIWVYYTSLCANAGDSSDCKLVTGSERPAFESHDACSSFRDADLGREHNPRLMGSCLKQREA